MDKKPKILLTNDDGADAPGLWVLFDRLQAIADPVVLAPMTEQSGRGHAVTIRERMALEPLERNGRAVGWKLDGMPADCVKLALSKLYAGQIDLVISGINPGSNAGNNILYSGTVAGAIEGAIYGVPAMAVSLRDENSPPTQFATAARVAETLARDIFDRGLPEGVVLNVNVPDLPSEAIRGAVLTRQGQELYIDLFELDGAGSGVAWCMNIGTERIPSESGEHPLDDLALHDRQVSITPLQFNLTCEASFRSLQDRFDRLEGFGRDRS